MGGWCATSRHSRCSISSRHSRTIADSLLTDPDPVRRYIDERREELGDWDILFAGLEKDSAKSLIDRSLGFDLVCQRRSEGRQSNHQKLLITNKQRVASRGVEKIGLSGKLVQQAKEEFRQEKGEIEPDRFP